jgi:hypothetical protein
MWSDFNVAESRKTIILCPRICGAAVSVSSVRENVQILLRMTIFVDSHEGHYMKLCQVLRNWYDTITERIER